MKRLLLSILLLIALATPASAVTRLYLPSTGDVNITPGFAAWGLTTSADRRRATISKTGTALTNKASAAVGVTTTRDVLLRQYLSDPLSGPQTVAGTVKGVARTLESLATANAQAQLTIKVVSKDGTTVRGTLLALSTAGATSEFTTALTNRKYPVAWASTVALSSVSALDGDRIAVEIGARFIATTVATTTATVNFGDAPATDIAEDETSTTANAPWLELSQTLTFQAVPELVATGTYLTGATATSGAFPVPGSPAANDIDIIWEYKENSAAVTWPAGFTEFITVTTTDHTLHAAWKRLAGTESGTYTASWTGSVWREGYVSRYRNCVTSGNPYEALVTAFNNTAATASPAVTVVPVTDNSRIVWVASNFTGVNPWVPPANFALRTSATALSDVASADRVWNGTASTGSLSATESSGRMAAAGFALKPAAVAATFNPNVASMIQMF
jgi:hypothetical protein